LFHRLLYIYGIGLFQKSIFREFENIMFAGGHLPCLNLSYFSRETNNDE